MADNPHSKISIFNWCPDLTEPPVKISAKQGSFMETFLSKCISVNRYATEQEEWLRYGRKFYTKQ